MAFPHAVSTITNTTATPTAAATAATTAAATAAATSSASISESRMQQVGLEQDIKHRRFRRRRRPLVAAAASGLLALCAVFRGPLVVSSLSPPVLFQRPDAAVSISNNNKPSLATNEFKARRVQLQATSETIATANDNDNYNDDEDNSSEWSRRDLLESTARVGMVALAGCVTSVVPPTVETAVAKATQGNRNAVVAVVGASGRTGSLCVNACLRRGIRVRALTRTGEWTSPPNPEGAVTSFDGDTSGLLSVAKCDVTASDETILGKALEGCSAVIYAASASKKGGSAYQVDHKGVVKVATACASGGVARCVVISSTATTRPKSLGYVFTNLGVGGNIMGEKRNGELGLMEVCNNNNNKLSYTILRPGGLEEAKRNKVLGPEALELSQGDVFSGIISRADVAELTVELALSESPGVRNTSLELYYKDSAVEVEKKFKPLLAAASNQGSPENKQLRLNGSTYSELLGGIRSGIDVY